MPALTIVLIALLVIAVAAFGYAFWRVRQPKLGPHQILVSDLLAQNRADMQVRR